MTDSLPPSLPTDDKIRRLLAKRVDAHRLSRGLVVGLADGAGRRVVAHGHTDATMAHPVDADTLFEIGSITKLFTALVLADMVDKSEAALDEPVGNLLPGGVRVPARNGRPITLLDLARHRSGLPRMPANFGLDLQTDPAKTYTPDMLYAFLAGHDLTRTPGDVEAYSNLGYGLLGHALALRATTPFELLVRSRVLAPLAMHRTVIAVPPHLAPTVATGHDDALDPIPAWRFGAMEAAGAFRSSAADMLQFVDALRQPTASPLATALASLTKARQDGGLGFGTPHPDGGLLYAHAGGTGGFRSHLGCLPVWDRGVVVLSNAMMEITADLGLHILDTRFRLLWYRTEVPADPAHLLRLTGTYRLTPSQIFDVVASGDRLLVQLSGQKAYRVFPTSDWTFFYKCVGAQLTFEPGEDGRAARVILHQNSLDQIAERIA